MSADAFLGATFSLQSKRVLITGASSGFGEHFARLYAKGGCAALALLARRTDKLEALATELRAAFPALRVATVRCDVSDVKQIGPAFAEAERLTSGLPFDVV
jgi:short-subunit dehydrogenase